MADKFSRSCDRGHGEYAPSGAMPKHCQLHGKRLQCFWFLAARHASTQRATLVCEKPAVSYTSGRYSSVLLSNAMNAWASKTVPGGLEHLAGLSGAQAETPGHPPPSMLPQPPSKPSMAGSTCWSATQGSPTAPMPRPVRPASTPCVRSLGSLVPLPCMPLPTCSRPNKLVAAIEAGVPTARFDPLQPRSALGR